MEDMNSNESLEKARVHLTTEELGKVFKYVSDNLVLACESITEIAKENTICQRQKKNLMPSKKRLKL